ncbi:hypothetical protein AFV9_gp46 [Betalipothrixvirus uzonense]|uniref:Uncharacterized protein n=1 Tax=Betalipothrixvirus uzonense TaxID=512792 RepID=B2CRM3_9VIRU|nr:hypothetical protein AFV9_gp46 [Acidianus filamentous virus 9]ACB37280.1 hypothetical protein [Acidianus filamentous virus 9]
MSLFNINISGVASEVETALYDYLIQPIECLVQDAINWIVYITFYLAKVVCDLIFSFLQSVYNFVLQILQNIIQVIAGTINNVVSTLRAKLVPAFVVAITPRGEELLIRYAIRGITHANNFKQGLVRGFLAGMTGISIPLLAYLSGIIMDSVIPNTQIDVTNLLFPIQTLQQLSKDICCPISAVTPPQCSNTCGVTGFPVCTPPCLELSNGNTYCFGVQFISQTSTSTTPTTSIPPSQAVYFLQQMTVTTS